MNEPTGCPLEEDGVVRTNADDLAFSIMVNRFCQEQAALRVWLAEVALELATSTPVAKQTGGRNEQN